MLRAAKVLGIELIVLDQSGHWLELHENACLRDRFVSLEMTNDDCLAYQIVQALGNQDLQLAGLTSNLDWHMYIVAQAAKNVLGRVFDSRYNHVMDVNSSNVEEYCAGPEVDVNFVLSDGKVLFAEVADDFPKAGDRDRGAESTAFQESAVVFPSPLPTQEIEILKTSLHQTLLDMGFRTGVYHVEARVNNSRKRCVPRDGITDLEDVIGDVASAQPSAFLVEVNPRSVGEMAKVTILRAYGIDYHALHLLLAVGDTERAAALSQPFVGAP
ncbi:hypothetical protein G7Y79_00006g018910 [Physcia stellaris]|nr:hypothetical protein G7Y79_00006g018910 [Physcia stellaris]